MMKLLEDLVKAIDRLLDPVCQDPTAVLFGEYNGHYVRLVPIVGAGGHIDRWVPDFDEADRTDRLIAQGRIQARDDAQPATQATTPAAQATFDPAGVAGL